MCLSLAIEKSKVFQACVIIAIIASVSTANIRLSRRNFKGANAPSYFSSPSPVVRKKKRFITSTPGRLFLRLYRAVHVHDDDHDVVLLPPSAPRQSHRQADQRLSLWQPGGNFINILHAQLMVVAKCVKNCTSYKLDVVDRWYSIFC